MGGMQLYAGKTRRFNRTSANRKALDNRLNFGFVERSRSAKVTSGQRDFNRRWRARLRID